MLSALGIQEFVSYVYSEVSQDLLIQLKDAIIQAADGRAEIRERLISLARDALVTIGPEEKVKAAQKEFDQNVKYLDSEHFFNILLMNPGVEYEFETGHRRVRLDINKNQPLCNLYFMRDQQFVSRSA